MHKYFKDNIEDTNNAKDYLLDMWKLFPKNIFDFYNKNIKCNSNLFEEYGEKHIIAVANYIKDRPILVYYNHSGSKRSVLLKNENELREFIDINNDIEIVECLNHIKNIHINLSKDID